MKESLETRLRAAQLGYGCMRLIGDGSVLDRTKGKHAIHAAIDAGIELFDHADIYSDGQCEALFGELLAESPNLRDQLILQTKCGIRLGDDNAPKRYDNSKDYILNQVEHSLRRLRVEYIDVLLLHRPDYLAAPEQVAEAFSRLRDSGKVCLFGVSNFSASQIELLCNAFDTGLVTHQTEINLYNIDALTNGVLDQCQRLDLLPQAWCPLAAIAYSPWGDAVQSDVVARLQAEVKAQAATYNVDEGTIPLAWLQKHPARIIPIIGTTTPARIRSAAASVAIDYRRRDWYRLLEAHNGTPIA